MPHKIVPLGPWKRDANLYQEGNVLTARNVSPMVQGYRGGFLPGGHQEVTIGVGNATTTTDIMHAHASPAYLYATQYGAVSGGSGTGKILVSTAAKNGGTVPTNFTDITPTSAPKWEGDTLANITQYGKYVVFGSLVDKIHYFDDSAHAGLASPLCSTTAPTGSSYLTADIKARFVFTYKDHLVAAHIKMAADYPSANTIYSNNTVYDSLVWFSMADNIKRFATPTVHPMVKGSIPINLLDDMGPITGVVGGEQAYIFKESCVYKIVGPPFDAVRISKDIGTISPNSIVEVGGVVYFMSNRGTAMIDGDGVRLVDPEMFGNALRYGYFDYWTGKHWYDSVNTYYMLPTIACTSDQLTKMIGTYSDKTGCLVWTTNGGQYIMMQATPPFNMSHGETVFYKAGDTSWFNITANARSPGSNYFPDTGQTWLSNFLFGKLHDGTGNVNIAPERYSGFTANTASFDIQFTTPMISLHPTENGPEVCRPTAFRLIGESPGKVIKWSVRTSRSWNLDEVYAGASGTDLTSRDGWVQLPSTHAGRFHSLSFSLYLSDYSVVIGEAPVTFVKMPFFSAIDIMYEVAPARTA